MNSYDSFINGHMFVKFYSVSLILHTKKKNFFHNTYRQLTMEYNNRTVNNY